MKKIERVEAKLPAQPKATRVAAYARVSTGKDTMKHSLSVQVSKYSELIQSNPEWQYAGVYADEAISGTKNKRPAFQQMLNDCRDGRIDLIITKSISRFARNSVTLLETVRELKKMNVDVFFEEQNLHSMSNEGELILSILASLAEEESRSVSENMKWRIHKNFEEGIPWDGTVLGYRLKDGKYIIEPDEAETIRFIYREYLSGKGMNAILNELRKSNMKTRLDAGWHISAVERVLKNYTYTGNLMLQKTYSKDYLSKVQLKNKGELPMYHAENTHEPIVSLDDFLAVQTEIENRRERNTPKKGTAPQKYPFSGLIVCGNCGKHFRRKATRYGTYWICATYNFEGKEACSSKMIPEPALISATEKTIGSVDNLKMQVVSIVSEPGNQLVFRMKDGAEIRSAWESLSRRKSWTREMKEAARQRAIKQRSAK